MYLTIIPISDQLSPSQIKACNSHPRTKIVKINKSANSLCHKSIKYYWYEW